MNRKVLVCCVSTVLAYLAGAPAQASVIQVGDLRIGASDFSALTYFDPGFGTLHGGSPLTTRSVVGAPVNIDSNFFGTTSDDDGDVPPSSADDIGLRTFTSVTQIRTLNRFLQDTTLGTGTDKVGAVQWSLDLSPLDSYLATNSLALTALNLDLLTNPSDDLKKYDVYLSYSNPAESISLASISTSASTNHDGLWLPAQSLPEGSVVNGTHTILELGFIGDLSLSKSLLLLYNAGVKNFNLVMTSGDFFSGRTIEIKAGSGVSIDTVAVVVPEPNLSAMMIFGCFLAAAIRGRRKSL